MADQRFSGLRLRLLARASGWPLVGRLIGRLGARQLFAPLARVRDPLPPPLYSPRPPPERE